MTESTEVLCKQIRRVLSQPDAFTHDQLADLAERYGRQVDLLNDRLDRAHGWLRQGLRSEALGLAEQQPDLVDTAVQLCLGYGWREWSELCKSNGVDGVRSPDVGAAADLSTAYDHQESVEAHLVKHRMLALANAPLRERLDVLRVLSKCERESPIWREQRRDLESHRLEQIGREAQKALSANALITLRHLEQELQNSDWLAAPPEQLRKAVAKSVRKLERAEATTRYGSLANELHEAQGMQDEHALAGLVEEWEQLLAGSGVEPEASVATEVAPILSAWRHSEAVRLADGQFQEDLARMEELLDDYSEMSELEPLYEKLCRAERELPRSIIVRYDSRRDEFKRQRGFRLRMIAGSAVCAIILVAGGLGWWITEHNKAREVETWVAQLDTALRDEDLTKTEHLLEELDRSQSAVSASAPVAARRAEYEALVKADETRRRHLQACINEIESSDPLDPAVDKKLKEGNELARTEEERLHVATLRDRIALARRESQSAIDDSFKRVLVGLNNDYREIRGSKALGERIPALEDLAKRYGGSIQGTEASKELIATAKAQLRTWRHDLGKLQHQAQRARAVAGALEKLSAKYGDLDSYAEAARRFVDAFPESPEAQALQTVLRDSQAWFAIERWNAQAELWQGKLAIADVRTAQRLSDEMDVDIPKEVIKVGNELQAALSEYFARAAASLDASDSGIARLGRFFGQEWMRRLRQIQRKDGSHYYVLDGEVGIMSPSPPLYNVTGVVLSLEALMEPSLRKSKYLGAIGDPNLARAPMSLFSEEAGMQLEKQGATHWRTIHMKLAQQVIAFPDLDPLLRLQLTRFFVLWHRQEGWPPTSDDGRIVEWLDQIEEARFGSWNLGDVPWPDPESREVARARNSAKALIAQLPDPGDCISQSDAAFRELEQRARKWRPIGLVWRSDQGETAFIGTFPGGPVGIARLDGSGAVAFVPRGTLQEGALSFSEGPVPEFGTPLFSRPPWFSDSNADGD